MKSFSGSTVVPADFECFLNFEVVGEAAFFFVLHVVYDCKVVVVKGVGAVLIVLCNTGVVPLRIVYGPLVFLPPNFA